MPIEALSISSKAFWLKNTGRLCSLPSMLRALPLPPNICGALHKNALSDSISAAFYIFLRILLFLILRWSLYPIRQKRRRKIRGGALANGTYRLSKQRTAWSAKTLIGMQICRVPWRPKFDSFGGGNLAQAILCSRARLSLFLEQGKRREIFRQLKTIRAVEIAARRAEVLRKRDMLCAFFLIRYT